VRFLIDECLSVDLVTVAGQCGHEAQHVAHVGRAGWKDGNVVRYAGDGDFVLVTNTTRAISGSSTRRNRCMPALSF
jgi:predicted nuclease of predicted toxin-antitoxin system